MVYDFAIKNHNFKKGFNFLLTLVHVNQDDIDYDYICSTYQAKILPPPAWPTLQLFWDSFTLTSLANFRKVQPPAKVWGYKLWLLCFTNT